MNLDKLREEYNKQDNLCTMLPVYIVQDLEFITAIPLNSDYHDEGEYGGNIIKREKHEESEREYYALYRYVDKVWFLTRKAAEAHIEGCSYRFNKPRIWVDSFNKSDELRAFFLELGFINGMGIECTSKT